MSLVSWRKRGIFQPKNYKLARLPLFAVAFAAIGVITLFVTKAATTTHSVWPSTTVPQNLSPSSDAPAEVGMRFKTSVNGRVKGIKFYKIADSTGSHTGSLWSSDGQQLASIAFTNETASGWQTAQFNQPVNIVANVVYTVSYFAPNGKPARSPSYFTAPVTNGAVTALGPAEGGNGVYASGTESNFPSNTSGTNTNFWVDVMFETDWYGPDAKPAPPVNLNATQTSQGIVLTWEPGPAGLPIKEYRVRRNGSLIATVPTPTQTYTDTGVTSGTTYTYEIRQVDTSGVVSDSSSQARVTRTTIQPPQMQVEVRPGDSLASAVANATDGATITIFAGTYPREVLTKQFNNGIVIKAASGQRVVLDGIDFSRAKKITVEGIPELRGVHIYASSFITLRNNTFTNNKSSRICNSSYDSSIGLCQASNNIVISDNVMKKGGFAHVHVYGGLEYNDTRAVYDVVIRNNDFSDPWRDIVYISGTRNFLIEKNVFRDLRSNCIDGTGANCHSDGIQATRSDGLRIINNEFSWPLADGADQAMIIQHRVTNAYVANNLCHHWKGSCLTIGDVNGISVVNNTLLPNADGSSEQMGILIAAPYVDPGNNQLGEPSRNVFIWNNILTRVQVDTNKGALKPEFESNNTVLRNSSPATGASNNTTNQLKITTLSELFSNTTLTDSNRFVLRSAATGVNSGLTSRPGTPSNDFELRTRDTRVDRGAREYR